MTRALLCIALFATSAAAQPITVFVTGGKSMTSYHGQSDLQSFDLEWTGRQWKHNTEAGVALASQFIRQESTWTGGRDHAPKENVRGLAASMIVRHFFRSRYCVELASGPMWSNRDVPAATSRFNFQSHGGAGIVMRSLILGVRFGHISNGGTAHRNPGVNYTAAVVGFRLAS